MPLMNQLQPRESSLHLPPPPFMEFVSLGVGIFALVGVFDNAMTFFACVRVAKSFDSDLQTYICRLKILQLRLSRWGKAVGLAKEIKDVRNLKTTALGAQDVPTAKQVLQQIGILFDTARKTHPDLSEAQDRNENTMIGMLDEMSICRPRKASMFEKAKWAVYKKEDLSKLVDDLKELVSDLYELIPGQTQTITQLCNEEVSQLLEQGRLHASALALLEETASSLDIKLAEAIAQRKDQTASTSTINNYNHSKAINMGNVYGGQTNHVNF